MIRKSNEINKKEKVLTGLLVLLNSTFEAAP